MNSLLNGFLVFLGVRPPNRRAPSARRKAPARKPGVQQTRRPAAAARTPPQRPKAQEFGEGFGGAARTAETRPERPAYTPVFTPTRRRSARIGGFGMMFLAGSITAGGAWVGSEVQALAIGMRAQSQKVLDMSAMSTVPVDQATRFTF